MNTIIPIFLVLPLPCCNVCSMILTINIIIILLLWLRTAMIQLIYTDVTWFSPFSRKLETLAAVSVRSPFYHLRRHQLCFSFLPSLSLSPCPPPTSLLCLYDESSNWITIAVTGWETDSSNFVHLHLTKRLNQKLRTSKVHCSHISSLHMMK